MYCMPEWYGLVQVSKHSYLIRQTLLEYPRILKYLLVMMNGLVHAQTIGKQAIELRTAIDLIIRAHRLEQ